MEGVISLGPYGGSTGGDPWSYKLTSDLKEITIHEGGNIKSISFKEVTHNLISGTFGGNSPNHLDLGQEIKIGLNWPFEHLICISGTHGEYNNVSDVIISLTFQTNFNTYGPYGSNIGEPFVMPIEDSDIAGFFGRSGYYLDAFGLYVKPEGSISFGDWGGPGGSPFSFTVGKSWIKQITINHDSSNIKSLLFKDGHDRDGTYGEYRKMTVITSISFITNLKTYGPFGGETGTAFSLPIQGGVIVGFHGKSGDFIDSIGIFVKPEN
ncbi:hypothetical protein F8388_011879 [Cannabis sativa]|uniref:Jacalin-type lectin domain-containing protein n=1 Tax=Cannabis sativa TaxID=3483 RepID=A0A7J6H0J1_CANSA|nr:hypothetical protein F8388_011879 [Cannabis sativa]KAF4388615.1 hypothetical protein G4B88_018892 [Cannabis sativa]